MSDIYYLYTWGLFLTAIIEAVGLYSWYIYLEEAKTK